MEKKKIKMKLNTVILLAITIALIIIGIFYYFKFIKNNKNDIEEVVTENDAEQIVQITELPKIDGATAMLPMVKEIAKSVYGFSETEADEWLSKNTHGNTAQVYSELINKELDVIFVSEPSDDIIATAKEKGVEFEMVGIGYDGFVFVVNKENPVDSLTVSQIQDIYTGKITNWKEVGGSDKKIIAYQREKNSGSQNLMEKMVMKGLTMMEPATVGIRIDTMAGLIDAISGTESYQNSDNAIGYSIYLYAKEQYVRDNIKFLRINNIMPSDETIANGTYPLKKTVYAVYRKDENNNENVINLINWLKTENGQKAVIAGGYVGL